MKTNHIFFFLLILWSVNTVAQSDSEPIARAFDRSKILLSFDNLKTALLNEDGKDALKYIDSRTINYYGGILKNARTLDSTETEKLPFLDKVFVFITRHLSLKDKLGKMADTSFFIYAIEHKMIDKIWNSIGGTDIDTIIISKDSAKARLMVSKEVQDVLQLKNARIGFPYLFFYKEKGAWKVNLTSQFPFTYMGIKYAIKNSGLSETQFLLTNMQQGSKEKVSSEIWKPIEP
jgi:hypothetical protein